MAKGAATPAKTDVLQGTLDLMILTRHSRRWGRCTATASPGASSRSARTRCRLNEGTVYTSLMRLQQQRWISASWGTSENNRKARFYAITKAGRRQLSAETRNWERISAVMARLLRTAPQ